MGRESKNQTGAGISTMFKQLFGSSMKMNDTFSPGLAHWQLEELPGSSGEGDRAPLPLAKTRCPAGRHQSPFVSMDLPDQAGP